MTKSYCGATDTHGHGDMATIPTTVTTINLETGERTEKPSEWKIMPAPAGTCPDCAVDHEPGFPHNQQSLHYQYTFYGREGRWPTWADAMAHCSDEMKTYWINALSERGIAVKDGEQ